MRICKNMPSKKSFQKRCEMLDFSKFNNSCVKCGKCIPDCTIHGVNADEITSPRGFLDLILAVQNKELELNKQTKAIFDTCFLCTNCVAICPSHIRVDSAIEGIRYESAKKFGIAWYKKLAFYLLGRRKILDLVAKFGFVFQSCGFKITQNESMRAKFSLPLIKKGRLLPSLAKKSFLATNPDFIDNGGTQNVGFFVGCLANYAYTSTAFAVLKIAKELKINVDLMKEQHCCGAPQYFTGDFDNVAKLAKKNIAYFEKKLEKLDFIIVPEATCSAMLNVDYEHLFELLGDEKWAKRAEAVSKRILLCTKYFYEHTTLLKLLESRKRQDLSITYHDPCHARKMQGVFKEPRKLLASNFKLVELSEQNTCCGFGGVSMQLENYDKALKVGFKKAEDIQKTGVSVVSAECSACRMQISNVLAQKQSKVSFKSPLELIASVL